MEASARRDPGLVCLDGIYVGRLEGPHQYIIENLEMILEFVLAIITIFLDSEA